MGGKPEDRRNDHRISFRFLKLIYVPSVPAFMILNVMREQVIQVVEQYIDAVRRNDASALPLHPDAVCEFPTNTYRALRRFSGGSTSLPAS